MRVLFNHYRLVVHPIRASVRDGTQIASRRRKKNGSHVPAEIDSDQMGDQQPLHQILGPRGILTLIPVYIFRNQFALDCRMPRSIKNMECEGVS